MIPGLYPLDASSISQVRSSKMCSDIIECFLPELGRDHSQLRIIFMEEKDAVWSFWQVPLGDSQCKLLRFWSKTTLFITKNCRPLEIQPLVKSLVVVEIKHQIIRHQVTVKAEPLHVSWGLLDPRNQSCISSSLSLIRNGVLGSDLSKSRRHLFHG